MPIAARRSSAGTPATARSRAGSPVVVAASGLTRRSSSRSISTTMSICFMCFTLAAMTATAQHQADGRARERRPAPAGCIAPCRRRWAVSRRARCRADRSRRAPDRVCRRSHAGGARRRHRRGDRRDRLRRRGPAGDADLPRLDDRRAEESAGSRASSRAAGTRRWRSCRWGDRPITIWAPIAICGTCSPSSAPIRCRPPST